MIIATHQPFFLPWTGFFAKAAQVDCLVLLDAVQFPRGRGWMTRNRLKSEAGERWLTVPVHRHGRGFQSIHDVEIYQATNWRRKHVRSIQQWYANAPYLDQYLPAIERIYGQGHHRLVSLNGAFIELLCRAFQLRTRLILQSELGITGQGTELIVRIAERLSAERYLTSPMAVKYLDENQMAQAGIEIKSVPFYPPVYPQLWGDFIPNLSALDLVLNCGPAGPDLLARTMSARSRWAGERRQRKPIDNS